MESAMSYICARESVGDDRPTIISGASAGLSLRYRGLDGIPDGSEARAALSAACTSRAQSSMLRAKSNCKVTRVLFCELREVISVTPAMRPRARSSGVATVAAMVSGLAPGKDAVTAMVGKSTCGKGAMGSCGNAAAPATSSASVSSKVATGRRMNGALMFMPRHPAAWPDGAFARRGGQTTNK